jgi:hypothetical protein
VLVPVWRMGPVFHLRTQSNGNCLEQVIGKVGLLPL